MKPRELVYAALEHRKIDRVPRELWTLPGIRMFRGNELELILERFPNDIVAPAFTYPRGDREQGIPNIRGQYTDAWGCVWHVAEAGVVGEVKGWPLEDWKALEHYMPPFEILDNADFSKVNEHCANIDRFVLAVTNVRPFERMQFLRGTENLFMDLAVGVPEIRTLIGMIHEFNLQDISQWCKTDVDGIFFMDDWGSQNSLLISPAMWRELFKPMYAGYCEMIHEAGKKVFFHSDGNISLIMDDLIEIGIDAVNSQLFCMNIEELAEKHGGKITFWGEIDRQWILPFGTSDDVRVAVRRVRKAFDKGMGGVIAQCEWGKNDPFWNIVAVFEEWENEKNY
jgi:uroporphyrinogen decarboxylase